MEGGWSGAHAQSARREQGAAQRREPASSQNPPVLPAARAALRGPAGGTLPLPPRPQRGQADPNVLLTLRGFCAFLRRSKEIRNALLSASFS